LIEDSDEEPEQIKKPKPLKQKKNDFGDIYAYEEDEFIP